MEVSFDNLDLLRFYGLSAVGLVSTRLLLYAPMTLKTRMQTEARSSAWSTVQRLGVRGLYRGAMTVSLGIVPTQWLYLTALEMSKSRVSDRVAPVFAGRYQVVERMLVNGVAGGLASCGGAVVGVPLDVVTQRMQLGEGSLSAVAGSIWRSKGIAGFFQGYTVALATYAPTSIVWWTTFGNTRALMEERLSERPTTLTALAGGVAGVTAAVTTNPLDVLRTRKQTAADNPPLFKLARDLFATEGVRGFFRGATARAAAMGPNSVLMIISYELVKRYAAKTQ
jgi:solute carrier family 25 protein 44